jgi:predicted MFS family arabinose efflux permease
MIDAVDRGAAGVVAKRPLLLAARVSTALSQAVFWAVVTPAAAALFPPKTRGGLYPSCTPEAP